jgi:hypothetical protein
MTPPGLFTGMLMHLVFDGSGLYVPVNQSLYSGSSVALTKGKLSKKIIKIGG